MIDAIAALQQIPAANVQDTPKFDKIDYAAEPLHQPSAAQATDFARAASVPLVSEMQAAPPPSADGLSHQIGRQMDALIAHLKGPESAKGSDAAATLEGGTKKEVGLDKDRMAAAVSQMERAYMFAIETTMASRGSTESIKIFNTLLKGQ
jgi:hypothetical protein